MTIDNLEDLKQYIEIEIDKMFDGPIYTKYIIEKIIDVRLTEKLAMYMFTNQNILEDFQIQLYNTYNVNIKMNFIIKNYSNRFKLLYGKYFV